MTLENLLEGIAILRPYYDDPNGYHVGAEHDEVWLYATDRPLSTDDVRRMRALDWGQDCDAADEDEDPEAAATEYDPEESWRAFV